MYKRFRVSLFSWKNSSVTRRIVIEFCDQERGGSFKGAERIVLEAS